MFLVYAQTPLLGSWPAQICGGCLLHWMIHDEFNEPRQRRDCNRLPFLPGVLEVFSDRDRVVMVSRESRKFMRNAAMTRVQAAGESTGEARIMLPDDEIPLGRSLAVAAESRKRVEHGRGG